MTPCGLLKYFTDVAWNNSYRHVLTAVGSKVFSHFSFIVTACRYLINYMKDSCCFIEDYCSVIILSCTLLLVCPEFVLKCCHIAAEDGLLLMTRVTQQKLSRMLCRLVFFCK